MKKYIALKENATGSTHVKIEVYYNLGGYNVFTYKSEERGYYLSVCPVKRESRNGVNLESFTAFSGTKMCILPVTRKSKKAEANAEQIATEREKTLIDFVCNAHGLEVVE